MFVPCTAVCDQTRSLLRSGTLVLMAFHKSLLLVTCVVVVWGAWHLQTAWKLRCTAPSMSHALAGGNVTLSFVLKAGNSAASSRPNKLDWWYASHTKEWKEAFVLPKHKVVFCKIPKVGSSGFLRLLRWFDGQRKWDGHPYFEFQGHVANLTQLKHLPLNQSVNTMFDGTWTKMVVVRDPFDRLISAYSDKLSLPEPELQFVSDLNLSFQSHWNSSYVSFADFFTRMQVSMMDRSDLENVHWMRQSRHCGLERFFAQYNFAYYMPHDKTKHWKISDAILRTIAERSPEKDKVNISNFHLTDRYIHEVTAHASNHSHAGISEEICKKAQRLYAGDYELFGIPRPDCLPYFPFVQWPQLTESLR